MAFYVLAGLYVFSAIMILQVRTRRIPVPSGKNMMSDIREGIGYSFRDPVIRALLTVSLSAVFIGMYQPAIPVKVQSVLGLAEVGYGVMLALNGVGSLIGAIVLFSISKHIRKGYLLIFGLLMMHGAIALFAFAPNVFVTGVAMVWLGLAFSA